MAKKRTKRRGGRAGAKPASSNVATAPVSTVVKRFSMLDRSSPFDSAPPPASQDTRITQPPASSPALERAADAYAYRGADDEAPFSQRVTRPTLPNAQPDVDTVQFNMNDVNINVDDVHMELRPAPTTMLPPPMAAQDAPPVSHERVKAAEPAEGERPSDGTLDRLAEAYTPTFDVDEHRASPRVALEVELHVASESHFFTGLSGDISEGGVFVSTYRALAVGSEVDLEFTLPTSWQRVRARGRVRWHREPSPGMPPGVGIAFEAIDEIDRAAIERFCTTRPPLYYDDVG